MIKTTYQTPEIRNANDEIVQEGAFGKNTALSNATNDGWIDYVVNNLEALHDTIGDSAAHLDGNGHVVEPANLAIGDEDGNRLKTSYLKLTGGTVSGTLNVRQNLKIQDNQENVFGGFNVPASSATSQYLQIYGGENSSAGNANMVLFPSGDGRFQITGYNTDGSATYRLVSDNNGNLNWRGYPLAWEKDYLPLAGGTMSGTITTTTDLLVKRSTTSNAISLQGSPTWNDGATLTLYGKDNANSGRFILAAYNGSGGTSGVLRGYPDGALTWNGKNIERVESSGTNFIRYANGLQICFGAVGNITADGITVTFPQPFTSNPAPSFSTAGATNFAYVSALTATDMTVRTSNNGGYVRYIAIGRWA